MARIQEDVVNEGFQLMLKFLGTGSTFIYQVAHEGNVLLKQGGDFAKEFLLALINKQKERGEPTDAVAQMLDREEKGESIHTMLAAEEDAAELIERFNKKGVLFNVVENSGDDSKVFMYMSGDAQRVIDIVTLWQAERGLVSELAPSVFLDNFGDEGVGTLSGMDRSELEVFRRFARENGLIYSSAPAEEKDKHIVIYDPKDNEVVYRIMTQTIWALSGRTGSRLKRRLERFLKNQQVIRDSFASPEKEYYIVDGKFPEKYIHLTANDFVYMKNGKQVMLINRDDPEYLNKGLRVIDGMAKPVLLQREEFEQYKAEGVHDKEAVQKVIAEKTQNLPERNELSEAQLKQNERLNLIQSKMALDDENTAGFWIYDPSITFSDGGSFESTEDIDEQAKEDLLEARSRVKQFKFYEVKASDHRNLDYFIAEAEKYRKQPTSETRMSELDR